MEKYKLNCYGWSFEAVGKSLTDEQVSVILDTMKEQEAESVSQIRFDLEELLGIDIWDGELFHLSQAFDNNTMHFVVENEEGEEVLKFEINEMSDLPDDYYEDNEFLDYDAFPKEDGPRNVYLSVDENKGGIYQMEFESDELPKPEDFTYTRGSIGTPNGDWDFVDKIRFKGNELEILDWLDNNGKASTLEIFTHDDQIIT